VAGCAEGPISKIRSALPSNLGGYSAENVPGLIAQAKSSNLNERRAGLNALCDLYQDGILGDNKSNVVDNVYASFAQSGDAFTAYLVGKVHDKAGDIRDAGNEPQSPIKVTWGEVKGVLSEDQNIEACTEMTDSRQLTKDVGSFNTYKTRITKAQFEQLVGNKVVSDGGITWQSMLKLQYTPAPGGYSVHFVMQPKE